MMPMLAKFAGRDRKIALYRTNTMSVVASTEFEARRIDFNRRAWQRRLRYALQDLDCINHLRHVSRHNPAAVGLPHQLQNLANPCGAHRLQQRELRGVAHVESVSLWLLGIGSSNGSGRRDWWLARRERCFRR